MYNIQVCWGPSDLFLLYTRTPIIAVEIERPINLCVLYRTILPLAKIMYRGW
jgi:hypothetical protein